MADQPMEHRWGPWKLQTCCRVHGLSSADGRMQEEEKLFHLGQQPGTRVGCWCRRTPGAVEEVRGQGRRVGSGIGECLTRG